MSISTHEHEKLIRSTVALWFTAAVAFTSSAQNLTVTDGLSLWLKADAGVATGPNGGVLQWDDQSGNANHAAQGDENLGPALISNALNNQPALRFDGVDDYLEVADSETVSIAGDITSFFVVSFDDFNTFRSVWAKTAVSLPASTDMYAVPGSGLSRERGLCVFNRFRGLKARPVTAWAEASRRAQAQVKVTHTFSKA